jgi:D-cysteine desulfhydrase
MRPPKRYLLANLPTRVHALESLGKKYGASLWMKRDDETGLVTSGNKIRKLEFLVQDATARGCNLLITWGAIQSNHARTTAAVAAQLGMDCLVLLRGEKTQNYQGNLLLDRLLGADVIFVDPEEYARIDAAAERFAERSGRQGKKAYLIPEGGSNALGSFGYVQMMRELAGQMKKNRLAFDSIICAVGSGGTYAGLLLGQKLFKLKSEIIGFNVCQDAAYFRKKIVAIIEQAIERYHLSVRVKPDEIKIVDGYVGRGYALSTPDELATLREVAQLEGIILDPVYTGKTMHGLLDQLRQDPKQFGRRILFIHTGGIFGLFPKAEELSEAVIG